MSKAACRALLSAARRQTAVNAAPECVKCQIDPAVGHQTRASSSNSRWKMRQGKDMFAREAKVQGLKSRAAFKLLEMDAKYRIFRKGQTVVDLVAVERTKPNGRILGIDIIPAQPPKGVSTIQGNFLSPDVRDMVKEHLSRAKSRRTSPPPPPPLSEDEQDDESSAEDDGGASALIEDKPSYIDMERAASSEAAATEAPPSAMDMAETKKGRLVDIVLSDMSAPWDQTSGFGVNSLSNPYHRMMNTSGVAFRDHAGSMVRLLPFGGSGNFGGFADAGHQDLCGAALHFANDTLKNGGHFVCKFYQGSEDRAFEKKLKVLFAKVFREKPESSRSDSKEAYFVALRRRGNVQLGKDEDL
ncbi:rRNA methyltransferase 2, mitochondrial [Colletotrichum tanaceti]|uniref:rRNA methyltransferase 2, mitochondrial n=1 Tax=Colletotrichum tanaceti TaxID=1306861 RepID=A0A4U6XP15_9PEZI|nr:rRNA methyltransferase 2, mitochondrial [Colletotrichum tanaceti]KAJ0167958.1 rRNA methyltransferase 2, mitochondrial [Colletotrichum tanaceti]TKW57309.1 rRNA methyltransferase 2, mitochondrial [Colletotrichum tanaceti]